MKSKSFLYLMLRSAQTWSEKTVQLPRFQKKSLKRSTEACEQTDAASPCEGAGLWRPVRLKLLPFFEKGRLGFWIVRNFSMLPRENTSGRAVSTFSSE